MTIPKITTMGLFQVLRNELNELDWEKNKLVILFAFIALSPTIYAIPNTQTFYYVTLSLLVTWLFRLLSNVSLEMLVFLFAYCSILAGVNIGECSIIAKGAVVVTDVPSYGIWGGVPSKKLKK